MENSNDYVLNALHYQIEDFMKYEIEAAVDCEVYDLLEMRDVDDGYIRYNAHDEVMAELKEFIDAATDAISDDWARDALDALEMSDEDPEKVVNRTDFTVEDFWTCDMLSDELDLYVSYRTRELNNAVDEWVEAHPEAIRKRDFSKLFAVA